jgi:hypothetical protein
VPKFQKVQMSANNISAAILIRENTLLPSGSVLETEAFLPGWRAVQNLDGRGVANKIEDAKWNFFFLAGAIRTTVFGREGLATLRRAIRRILVKQRARSFNSLEITKVVSKRFLGVPFLSISAHSRHIQEGMYLVLAEDVQVTDTPGAAPAPAAAMVFGER